MFCCWLLVLCDGLRQTEAAMPAKPVAVAVLLLVSHGARLAVVAIGLAEGQRGRKTHLGRSDLAQEDVWRKDARWPPQAKQQTMVEHGVHRSEWQSTELVERG